MLLKRCAAAFYTTLFFLSIEGYMLMYIGFLCLRNEKDVNYGSQVSAYHHGMESLSQLEIVQDTAWGCSSWTRASEE